MPRVVLDCVSKTYRDRRRGIAHALRDLSLAVAPGECLVLLGPSGCGKTTTLRLVAGLEDPEAGEIRIDGRDMAGVPPQDRDVAMVFQHFALYPHLSVTENLVLGLRLRKRPADEIARRLQATAEMLGLTPLLGRMPGELSGGERQRVAIGRAIIRQPGVLLLDEPLSNLDAPLRAQLRAELAALHRRTGATMLHVTHDQAEALAMAGRIAVLKEGALQQVATPETLHRRPANMFVAGFVGSPPMNLFHGTLRRERATATFQPAPRQAGMTWVLPAATASRLAARPDGELVLGLRPEHFHPVPADGDVRGVVTTVEPLGSETLLGVSAGGAAFVVRLPPGAAPGREEAVSLRVDWAAACFFDPGSGQAL